MSKVITQKERDLAHELTEKIRVLLYEFQNSKPDTDMIIEIHCRSMVLESPTGGKRKMGENINVDVSIPWLNLYIAIK